MPMVEMSEQEYLEFEQYLKAEKAAQAPVFEEKMRPVLPSVLAFRDALDELCGSEYLEKTFPKLYELTCKMRVDLDDQTWFLPWTRYVPNKNSL